MEALRACAIVDAAEGKKTGEKAKLGSWKMLEIRNEKIPGIQRILES